jgi:hypothetical protein
MEKSIADVRYAANEHYAKLSVEDKIAFVNRRLGRTAPGPLRWDWANQAFRRAQVRLARSEGAHPRSQDEIAFDRHRDDRGPAQN